jgi:hypothetical protein
VPLSPLETPSPLARGYVRIGICADCFPTNQSVYGEECTALGSPYVGKCKYNAAVRMMQHLEPSTSEDTAPQVPSSLKQFDQSEFGTGSSLNTIGYIYVPQACEGGQTKCALHVSFHGCQQTTADIGAGFVSVCPLCFQRRFSSAGAPLCR